MTCVQKGTATESRCARCECRVGLVAHERAIPGRVRLVARRFALAVEFYEISTSPRLSVLRSMRPRRVLRAVCNLDWEQASTERRALQQRFLAFRSAPKDRSAARWIGYCR